MDAESQQVEELKAEIARLKDQVECLEIYGKTRNMLITKLADKLQYWTHASVTNPATVEKLIQEAREATTDNLKYEPH